MRTFICAKNEAVVINGEVIVTVIDILDKKVVLAVDAPEWVEVFPEEHLMGRRPCPLAHVKGLGKDAGLFAGLPRSVERRFRLR